MKPQPKHTDDPQAAEYERLYFDWLEEYDTPLPEQPILATEAELEEFEREAEILYGPIFSQYCIECHRSRKEGHREDCSYNDGLSWRD
jgi:hypothetical protein